ncbi:MAG TPA: dihydrolipoamide acetyltransferase family protein [Verrucomicrobiae bacterium]|jgi:pyruvate dehydrogenase E2 component (dihydrolipoyllysine-residue acetyltransferase)|nr:dihydrolipoamide acetyltransferase family protein [Verrucomicrobiae bacterium]
MPREFALPDLGEGLTEAEIVEVLVHEGDVIAEDTPLLEVETDKAKVEIPSPVGGRVQKIHVTPGQTVKVGAVLVTFADAAGAAPAPAKARPVAAPSPAAPAAPSRPAPAAPRPAGPPPATPSTRRLARELGVDLGAVAGSGPGGRITDDDVRAHAGGGGRSPAAARGSAPHEPVTARAKDAAGPGKPLAPVGLAAPALPSFEPWGPVERVPLSHLRRTIAERMALSAALIPHVSHFDRADITELEAIVRGGFEAARERGIYLTLTSFLLKAVATALGGHPHFNASLDPGAGELVLKRYVHLGVAVATDRGLIVPVLRDVDKKPVLEIARELAALAQRVREGKATLDDLRGGSFTLTNIGALGGTGAIPIINYPEVAILAVARGRLEPVVREGQVVPRLLLPLTLTFDHRVADGADGARFAAEVVALLENPGRLLLGL